MFECTAFRGQLDREEVLRRRASSYDAGALLLSLLKFIHFPRPLHPRIYHGEVRAVLRRSRCSSPSLSSIAWPRSVISLQMQSNPRSQQHLLVPHNRDCLLLVGTDQLQRFFSRLNRIFHKASDLLSNRRDDLRFPHHIASRD